MSGKIGTSKGQVEQRLPVRLVHRQEETFGFLPVLGFQAALFGRAIFLPVIDPSSALEESVFGLHDVLRLQRVPRAKDGPLRRS